MAKKEKKAKPMSPKREKYQKFRAGKESRIEERTKVKEPEVSKQIIDSNERAVRTYHRNKRDLTPK